MSQRTRWGKAGEEEGGERKEELNWQCEQLVWLKGAHSTHCRAQDRGLGRGSTPRSLYLLEKEGFHSSDEGAQKNEAQTQQELKAPG